MKRTKIVCTLGPSSREIPVLEGLIRAGMDVARLNFSHGTHDEHRETFERVREASRRVGKEVAILQDLQGPKIRVGALPAPIELVEGALLRMYPGEGAGEREGLVIPTTYRGLLEDVRPGDRILLDDGLMELRVESVEGGHALCRVKVGGLLREHKGINLPGVAVSAPSLTEKDRRDLRFGAELGVDFVSLSFVRRPEDVAELRGALAEVGHEVPIIAKIEKPEAVEKLEAIVAEGDGVMVARGDLGVELGPEKVPLIQKEIIEVANRQGKLVITATQMLESMIHRSTPTRAEASDVANAVLDQTDAVMLSGETAVGAHPLLVVETMAGIIREVEASRRYRALACLPPVNLKVFPNAIAHAAASAAEHLEAKAIVTLSQTGETPCLVSDYRPQLPIIALVAREELARRLTAYWGVEPHVFVEGDTAEETIRRVDRLLVEQNLLEDGDTIIVTMGVEVKSREHTNTLKIHILGHPSL